MRNGVVRTAHGLGCPLAESWASGTRDADPAFGAAPTAAFCPRDPRLKEKRLVVVTVEATARRHVSPLRVLRIALVFFLAGPPLAALLSIPPIELINFADTTVHQAIASTIILVVAGFWMVYWLGGLPALIAGLVVAVFERRRRWPHAAFAAATGLVIGLAWSFVLSALYPDLNDLPLVLAPASALASLACALLSHRPAREVTEART